MSCLPNLNAVAGLYSVRWGGLSDEIRRTDLVLNTVPEEVIDKCKTICESVFKSILIYQKIKTEQETERIDMEGLKVLLLENIPFDELDKSILRSEIDYIVQLRNIAGIGGHGRSLQRQSELRKQVNGHKNMRVLRVIDSMLAFIIEFYEQTYPINSERFTSYDEYLDTSYVPIQIEGQSYSASEIFSSVNPEGYKEAALEFANNSSEEIED